MDKVRITFSKQILSELIIDLPRKSLSFAIILNVGIPGPSSCEVEASFWSLEISSCPRALFSSLFSCLSLEDGSCCGCCISSLVESESVSADASAVANDSGAATPAP